MNRKKALIIVIILLFVLNIFLTIQFANGSILNLQAYIDFKIVPILFWGLIIAVSLYFTLADIGFLKIAAILGIITGVFVILFQMVYNTSEFDPFKSSEHELIIQRVNAPDDGFVHIYKKSGPFFSKKVESVRIAHYYELTFEIIGDTLIMNKCTEVSCIPVEIDLQ